MEDTVYIAKTFQGIEDVLADELREIGATDVQKLRRAVSFSANLEQLYRANYELRTAISILKNIAEFEAHNEKELYQNIYNMDWYKIFDIGKSFLVNAGVADSNITHSHYAALKVKDAIVDNFRDKFGDRPNVDTDNPNIKIDVLINKNRCRISLNSSGNPLFKRGYRQNTSIAPLNEVLAAGLIKLSGWDMNSDFIDPMCGSGTLSTEALMMAMDIPAQYYRNNNDFSFIFWTNYDKGIWRQVVRRANEKIKEFEHNVIANDISKEVCNIAMENFKYAKLHKDIQLFNKDLIDLKPEVSKEGTIVINPPYGERIKSANLFDLYSKIGDTLKTNFPGFTAWIISSDFKAMKKIGLKTDKRLEVFNGPLKCKYFKYNLYKGSLKE